MERQVVVVAALLALLLAVLALLVSSAGSSQFGDARTAGVVDGPLLPGGDVTDDEPVEEVDAPPEVRPPPWLPVLLVVVASLLMALAVRALRRVVRAVADSDDEALPVGDAAGDAHGTVLDELRTVARATADDLRREGTGVADAVVLCWERLEQLGERLGTPRPEHETPTEFGADLLRRNGADPEAVDDLLRLYHRARFGHGVGPADGDRAALALRRVADTLETADDAAPARGGAGG